MKLSELKCEEKAIIIKIEGQKNIKKRFLDMGVGPGETIEFIRSSPLGDPLHYKIKNYNLALRKAEVQNITIKLFEENNSKKKGE